MTKPTLQELDKIRNSGFRPQVVGCFLNDKKILFVFDKKYKLWQFPQGGIDNKETTDQAFRREMTEELGEKFINSAIDEKTELNIVDQDQIEFPISKQDTRKLQSDEGEKLFMKGKKYFFITADSSTTDLDIAETEFDNYKWIDFDKATILANEIYQQGKKRVIINILNTLKNSKFL